MIRLKILLFLIIIFLLSGLYFIENISQYFSNSKQVEYSRNQSKSKKVKTNMENNNIIIQAQGTQVSYFAGTRIKKSPKILITKGGTWNRIEDDIPLEKTMTKDGELTITELKKVRRVTQKKLSQSQMERLYGLIYKINNVEAVSRLNYFAVDVDDADSFTSLSINYNDGRPIVAVNISSFVDFSNVSSEEYYHEMSSHKNGEVINYEVMMSNWNAYIELLKFIYSL